MSKLLVILALASVGYIVGFVGLWIGDRTPPTRDISSQVLNNIIRPGDTIQFRTTGFRDRICYTVVERYMVDANKVRHTLTDNEFIAPGPIGPFEGISKYTIPLDTAIGPATIHTARLWECNPVHKLWPIVREQEPVKIVINTKE